MSKNNFSHAVTTYLAQYLPGQRGVSPNTIRSYRDTLVLLLRYARDAAGISPEQMDWSTVNPELVEGFLHWLEQDRRSAVSTRNQRLAALHAFCRYAMVEQPEQHETCQGILAISFKKTATPVLRYLTVDAIRAVLAEPAIQTPSGRRDLALLTVLYESGARVQEVVDLTWEDIHYRLPATLKLTGKGRKSRIVPLMPGAARILERYRADQAGHTDMVEPSAPVFVNQKGKQLSRWGVNHIVEKYVAAARTHQPDLYPPRISAHVLRHSKAMHLLEANVNLIYIRDLLGHVSVQTTEVYAKASPDMKRKALEKVSEAVLPDGAFTKEEETELLVWLKDLL